MHNRITVIFSSFHLCVSASRHLMVFQHLQTLPSQIWYCSLCITLGWMFSLCSTLFILSMAFERFYSIIKPHKAASFNTVKRAKITIVCIVIFSIICNCPHMFVTLKVGKNCVPFGPSTQYRWGQFYYWLSLIIHFFLPFVLLLFMNSVIIHKLREL